LVFDRKNALRQISDDLLSISPTLGKSVNNLLMNTMISTIQKRLSPSHFAIMKILYEAGEARISVVAYWLLIPRSQMTHMVDKLVNLGFVERKNDTVDRRVIKINLTDKGNQIYLEWVHKAVDEGEKAFNDLTDGELKDLADSLSKFRQDIVKILGKYQTNISEITGIK